MKKEKFILGVDYYIERNRWVFTEEYLRKRGFCCFSNCRHCPYKPEKEPDGNTERIPAEA